MGTVHLFHADPFQCAVAQICTGIGVIVSIKQVLSYTHLEDMVMWENQIKYVN